MSIVDGLMALDSYFKATDDSERRARERRRFEVEDAKATAGLAELPSQTEANIGRNRENAMRAQSSMQNLPLETAVRGGRLGAEQRAQEFNQTQEPVVQATTAMSNQAGLATAGVNAATANNNAANVQSDIGTANTLRGLNKQQQGEKILTSVGQYLASGDKAGALKYLNLMAADPDVFPETNGMKFTDIKVVPSPDGRGQAYQPILADGTPGTAVPAATFAELMRRNAPKGEYQAVTTNDGGVYSFDKKSGKATTVREGNPKTLQDKRPAEARLIDYYVGRGMSEGEAIQRASRLKDMSPNNAAFQLYKDRISVKPNASPDEKAKIRAEVEAEVQSLFGDKATPGAAAASNPNGAPTMNVPPNIQRLIGGG
jgi:hypothetical protein